MQKLFYTFTLLLAFTFGQAQNDIKARLEFEEAEKAFTEENYETALKHLNQTEKELGTWTPNVSYLKIECLYALTDMGNFGVPTMQPLYEEVTKYMAHFNKLNSDDIPMEKYKVVYGIEKTLKALKLDERQSPEFLKAKTAHDAKNYDMAIPIYEKLAQKGNSWAMRNLGLLYEEQKKDTAKAQEWYQKATDNGNAQAAIDLAQIDSKNDRKRYEKAAKMEHPHGVYVLGWFAENEDNNLTKATEYYRQATDLGSAAGLHKTGKAYENKKEYDKAFTYYKKAAIKGHWDAMVRSGALHFHGVGTAENEQIAMEYWLKAAEKRNIEAMFYIGEVYKKKKNYVKAEEWYLKAGAINSNYYSLLGELYSLSDNNNPQKALEYYEKAAENGQKSSILETANIYFSGKGGITKNYAKAAMYYEKYYDKVKKNESYIDNLIEMYNRGGNGIEKDKDKAKKWKAIRRK